MDVYIDGKRVRLDPSLSIGKGGEADVFAMRDTAIKVFKQPNHPDLKGMKLEQLAAKSRIEEHQKKLPAFPRNLPAYVITPNKLVYDRTGKKILGYTMQFLRNAEVLLRYADRKFRQAGVQNDLVMKLFLDLYASVQDIHKVNVVIGDFNDLNVLVRGQSAYLIDADSFQFGQFLCKLFTTRFADPLLCDPKKTSLELMKPHNSNSDWYAFTVMLMRCLLYVDPYGGIYRPKDKKEQMPHGARPLHRITVFSPEVKYPKPALRYDMLPDDLLQYFFRVFEKDLRGKFPIDLIRSIQWTTCTVCGQEHARQVCPYCAQAAPAAIKEVVTIRGRVTASRIFHTKGKILLATYQHGLKWLYHESGQFKREDHFAVTKGQLDPQMRFRIQGKATLMAKKGQLLTFEPGQLKPTTLAVDNYGQLPMFDANEERRFWLFGGHLLADGRLGPEFPEKIGDVLSGQTLFWVGPKFGFGFYRAGQISMTFVFNAKRSGINDTVKIPSISGQLIDSTCALADERAWLFESFQESGKIMNQCTVIHSDGTIEAFDKTEKGGDSWLGSIRGKCAVSNMLFSATDEGIVRVEPVNGQIVVTQQFPDTEPFVHTDNYLFAGKEGIYVVGSQGITLLKIK